MRMILSLRAKRSNLTRNSSWAMILVKDEDVKVGGCIRLLRHCVPRNNN